MSTKLGCKDERDQTSSQFKKIKNTNLSIEINFNNRKYKEEKNQEILTERNMKYKPKKNISKFKKYLLNERGNIR